jgi:hypothetical protein
VLVHKLINLQLDIPAAPAHIAPLLPLNNLHLLLIKPNIKLALKRHLKLPPPPFRGMRLTEGGGVVRFGACAARGGAEVGQLVVQVDLLEAFLFVEGGRLGGLGLGAF